MKKGIVAKLLLLASFVFATSLNADIDTALKQRMHARKRVQAAKQELKEAKTEVKKAKKEEKKAKKVTKKSEKTSTKTTKSKKKKKSKKKSDLTSKKGLANALKNIKHPTAGFIAAADSLTDIFNTTPNLLTASDLKYLMDKMHGYLKSDKYNKHMSKEHFDAASNTFDAWEKALDNKTLVASKGKKGKEDKMLKPNKIKKQKKALAKYRLTLAKERSAKGF